MNINLVIGLLFAVFVVGAGGYVAYNAVVKGSDPEPAPKEVQQGLQPSNPNPISGTFASLFALGQDLRCEFSYNDGANISSGTTYIAKGGERIRGDFTITDSAAGPMEAHLVRDGGYHYMWGTLVGQGIKMKIEAGQEDELFSGEADAMPIDENTEYNCTPWSVDQNVFAVPTDVEFTDLSMQMESMLQLQGSFEMDAANIQAQQCAACAQIPDASAKAQCLAALQCM